MKKLICFTISVIILGAAPVYANSAPSYWKAFPYSDVLIVEEDSPITVDREHLTFDFSGTYDHGDYQSPVGKVLAEYQMENPGDGTLSVQMAFPFAANLSNLSTSDIAVRADGTAVPYEIFIDPERINDTVYPGESFHYDYGSVGDISNREWALPGFDLDSRAKLYRFAVSGGEEDRLSLEVRFNADSRQTLLIGDGFNGASYSPEDGYKLHYRIRDNTAPEIIALGREPEFSWEVLTDEGKTAETDRYQLEIFQDSVKPKEYLLNVLSENLKEETAAAIADTQLLNPCLYEIWKENRDAGYAMISEVLPAAFSDRIFTLVYQVEFPPESSRSISVGYLTEGSMDRRETLSPKYSYTYLLSPAKNWADFGSLDIEIITPRTAPYVIESSPALAKDGENRYSGHFDGLPESELTFTLYENEKVTLIDKTKKKISESSYLLFFLWPVFLIILAVISVPVVIAILRRMRRV